jgi:hypothetical protein
MQRPLVLALVLFLAALAGALWWFNRGEVAPPLPVGPAVEAPTQPAGADVARTTSPASGGGAAAVREAVVLRDGDVLGDPEIRAALCGFKGRVVTHDKQPVADCGVRIYRGAMDSILPDLTDLLGEGADFSPGYVAGEVRTAADGTFVMTGVWPRGFYLMFAGLGTDAPTHQVITKTPGPGQIEDLGDVVLNDAGVITGTVHDDAGEPMANALVRAVDLPGTLAGMMPLERFDPKGAMLIRESSAPVRVMEFPQWVEEAFEHLPIPTTRTDGQGNFRLVGVVPGSNLLATTMHGFLSDVKPSVMVRAGEERNVGRIRMRRGEELVGRVVDGAGKAVARAEVLAGSTITMVPFDFAQRLAPTDDEGRFQGTGFAPGKVTVAARRGPGHPWVLAEPQSLLNEVVVTLPTTYSITATITQADGTPAKAPRLRLLQGRRGNGAAEMYMMGLLKPVPLEGRLEPVADGVFRITDLRSGVYTLLADLPSQATGNAAVEINDADVTASVQLAVPSEFLVRVVDHEARPVRNAAVFAEARGDRVVEMPVRCGRTDSDGRLRIANLRADSLLVSADHPRWGVVHGELKPGIETVLRLEAPGAVAGRLVENGKEPPLGKYGVALVRNRGSGPRGPLEQVPQMLTPARDGAFAATALQPGNYTVASFAAIDSLRSPGGVMGLVQNMFVGSDARSEDFEVAAGQTVEVLLEAGQRPIDGPTARLMGSVVVDGKLASGAVVQVYCDGRRVSAAVDDRGRFDLVEVPAGRAFVQVTTMGDDGILVGANDSIWSARLELSQGEVRELAIDVLTTTVSGFCYLPDGSPAAQVDVRASGSIGTGSDARTQSARASTDSSGAFVFRKLPAGTWSFDARSRDREARGKLEGVEAIGGVPVTGLRLQLQQALVVKGRIDMASLAKKPEWSWLGFHRADAAGGNGGGGYAAGVGVRNDGSFTTSELQPGRYRVEFQCYTPDEQHLVMTCGVIEVPATGMSDLVLVPRPQ